MYIGSESFILNQTKLPITLLNFWQWAYSNLLHNMHRGKLAEFIVKSALDIGNIRTTNKEQNGLEPFDLEGPIIPSTQKNSRLEIKSAAFVQSWKMRHPDVAKFSIAPAIAPDETGDYNDNATKQRNNDIYIFTLYTATDPKQNILDLSLWEFYVLPTYKIESDSKLRKQKTISLKSIQRLCVAVSFDELCDAVIDACRSIPADYDKYIIYPDQKK